MFLVHTPQDHVQTVARAVVGACRPDGWASPVQPKLLHTLFNRLLGQDLNFETLSPLAPSDVARALKSQSEREELIQLMAVMEILCNPFPAGSSSRWPHGRRRSTCTSARSSTSASSRAARWPRPCRTSTG